LAITEINHKEVSAMAIRFSAEEVFGMAVRIEKNGAAFYRRAAELHAGTSEATLFTQLAAMEDEHAVTFTNMSSSLTAAEKETQTFDPQDEAGMYLAALADTRGGEGSPAAAAELDGNETVTDVINRAIGLEKDSILFYTGLKEMVPANLGRDKIEMIITEEMRHVAQLRQHLATA
jgi:rubrerythrin